MARPLRWNERVGKETFHSYLRFQSQFDAGVRRILERAAIDVNRIVAQIPGNTFSELTRIAQYRLYQGQIVRILEEMWGEIEREIQDRIIDAANLAMDGVDRLIEIFAESAKERGTFDLFRLADGFEAAVHAAADNIRSRIINAIDLSPRVYRNKALASGAVDSVINNGIALGRSAKEIAAEVRSLISARAPGGVSYSALRLGRTELNNAYHRTQRDVYADQPWIWGVQWKLSGSHPRPDICNDFASGDHDRLGRGIFSPNNVPGKPHPQCLCYIVAATVSREDFVANLLDGQYDRYIRDRL